VCSGRSKQHQTARQIKEIYSSSREKKTVQESADNKLIGRNEIWHGFPFTSRFRGS